MRTQLSLYVPQSVSASLEAVRQLLDPIQAGLIPAHVTLCREDELVNLKPAELRSRLEATEATAITLVFGPPEPFHEHGLLLPCIAGEAEFRALRRWVLGAAVIKNQTPHITLAHPRNPKAPSNDFASAAAKLPGNLAITFTGVYRIQQEGFQPWQVLEQYTLSPPIEASKVPSQRPQTDA